MGVPETSEKEPPSPGTCTWSGELGLTWKAGVRRDALVEPIGRVDVRDADPQVIDGVTGCSSVPEATEKSPHPVHSSSPRRSRPSVRSTVS